MLAGHKPGRPYRQSSRGGANARKASWRKSSKLVGGKIRRCHRAATSGVQGLHAARGVTGWGNVRRRNHSGADAGHRSSASRSTTKAFPVTYRETFESACGTEKTKGGGHRGAVDMTEKNRTTSVCRNQQRQVARSYGGRAGEGIGTPGPANDEGSWGTAPSQAEKITLL